MNKCYCINKDALIEWLSMTVKDENIINTIIEECAHEQDGRHETDWFVRRCTSEVLEELEDLHKKNGAL